MTKKVLHIITGLNDGGAESVLTRLCLHSTTIQHVVISLIDEGKYGPLLTKAGVVVHCLYMKPNRPTISSFFRLFKLIRKEKPNVVQTWMYHADLMGGVAARCAGVRRVFWGIRHSTLEKGKSKRSTIYIAKLCALLSNLIPELIVCCAEKALVVHAGNGYSKHKLRVIPNGYDLSRFKIDLGAGIQVRTELGLSKSEFIIGNVGRYDPLKDYSNLLYALEQVAARKIPFRCLLVGKGLSTDNVELLKQVTELGIEKNVILVGQRTDIPSIMNALDLFVLSSMSEGFPNVLAEAMACGTPCVSTNVGDALDIIGDKTACCTARDPQALADLIGIFAKEWQEFPVAWENRKLKGRHRISKRFSIENMVKAYESLWFDAI